jgi:hypothetical protein
VSDVHGGGGAVEADTQGRGQLLPASVEDALDEPSDPVFFINDVVGRSDSAV